MLDSATLLGLTSELELIQSICTNGLHGVAAGLAMPQPWTEQAPADHAAALSQRATVPADLTLLISILDHSHTNKGIFSLDQVTCLHITSLLHEMSLPAIRTNPCSSLGVQDISS